MKNRNNTSLAYVACLLLCLLITTGHAQAQGASTGDDGAVLAALDDDGYGTRQAMTHALLMDNTLTPKDIDRLYTLSTTLEQRHRLLRVARHHMIRRMVVQRFHELEGPGSMGLTHHVVEVNDPDTGVPRHGVMVVLTLPGFPAYATLEPGDVIIEFAGEPIPDRMSATDFQNLIKSHQVNEQIELKLLRNGVPTVVPFTLSHNRALGTVYDTSEVTLSEPYGSRWRAERSRIEALADSEAEPSSLEGETADVSSATDTQ